MMSEDDALTLTWVAADRVEAAMRIADAAHCIHHAVTHGDEITYRRAVTAHDKYLALIIPGSDEYLSQGDVG